MAESPADPKLYFLVQDCFRPQLGGNSPDGLSKTGSMYNPQFPLFPDKPYDEVYPKLFLGNRHIVKDYEGLKKLGITHIINCSMGPKFNQINTSQEFYELYDIKFHGIPAMDVPSFQMLPYFKDAASFIDQALNDNGTLYVHCQQGVSRSSSVVIAFLMLKRNMDLVSAAKLVRAKRAIYPNDGFIKQLCELQGEIKKTKTD